ETAREMGVDLAKTSISIVIVSGEPGGSIPATRHAIEELWGAKCYELYGIAEIGPTNPGCPSREGNHLCEDWYHALVVDESGTPGQSGGGGGTIISAKTVIPRSGSTNRVTPCSTARSASTSSRATSRTVSR